MDRTISLQIWNELPNHSCEDDLTGLRITAEPNHYCVSTPALALRQSANVSKITTSSATSGTGACATYGSYGSYESTAEGEASCFLGMLTVQREEAKGRIGPNAFDGYLANNHAFSVQATVRSAENAASEN